MRGWMKGGRDGWVGELMDGSFHGWMDGWMYKVDILVIK